MAKDTIATGIEAQRLLNDPAFLQAIQTLENEIVDDLCSITMTGSLSCAHKVMEKVRALQANRRIRKKLAEAAQYGRAAQRRLEVVANQPKRVVDPRWSE